jgi:hypothetical protein
MDRYGVPQTALTIALHAGLYLAIIMGRYRGTKITHNIGLRGDPYLVITIDFYGGPRTDFTISLHGGLY